MSDANARKNLRKQAIGIWKGLRQNIVDKVRGNLLYLSITKFRHIKILLFRKWTVNRNAEITGSSQWIAIVVVTNNPPLCLILVITSSKGGPLTKNPKNIFVWKIFCINSLRAISRRKGKRSAFPKRINTLRRSDARTHRIACIKSAQKGKT